MTDRNFTPDNDDADETVSYERGSKLPELEPEPEPEDETAVPVRPACPMCRGKEFELIQLHGMNILLWNPIQAVKMENQEKQESKFAEFFGGRRVEAFRCRKCEYIILYAR